MLNVMDKLKALRVWMQNYISPVFISLLCASFILWYIVKLDYRYTTEYDVSISVDGEHLRVPCVVEGKGATLLGYRANVHKQIKIPLSELRYAVEQRIDEQTGEAVDLYCVIDPQSLLSAISVRFSDIKVISIGAIPPLPLPESTDDGKPSSEEGAKAEDADHTSKKSSR